MKNLRLEKEEDFYCLKQLNTKIGDVIIACSDEETSESLNFPFKISKENCDLIFGFYNLENLSTDYSLKVFGNNENSKVDFSAGFIKAIEILKHKQYSLLQIFEAFDAGEKGDRHLLDDVITKRNQKVDVIIEMDALNNKKPILDKDGFLILKKQYN
jgi:hypothetical protein